MARKIEIEVTGDTRSLERALNSAQRTSKSSFDKIGKAAKVAGLAIAGGLAVVAKVGFDELAASQKVIAQTGAVLKSTGGVANVTAKDVDALAASLSQLSGVDDELIGASENLLLTFTNVRNEVGKGNKVFDQATAAILDMSVATGTDLQSATLQVGKALQDPVKGLTALRRVGVAFTASQEKLIKKLVASGDVLGAQKVILAELNKEFAGSAKAAGDTLPGQLAKARNAFDEVAGSLVESLLPAVTAILKHLTRFTAWAQENPQHMQKIVIGLGALSVALLTATAAQTAMNLAVLANPYVAAAVAIVALGAAIALLVTKVDFFRKHWQVLLLGLGLMPVVIATVVKAVVRHFGTLSAGFVAVKNAAVAAFNVMAAVVRNQLGGMLAFLRNFVDVVRGVANKIGAALSGGILGALGGLASAVGGMVRAAINAAIAAFNALADFKIDPPGPGSFTVNVPDLPYIASGGTIASTGLAVVHRGEEVVPARVVNRGGSAGGRLRGRYWIMADADFVASLRELDGNERRRSGGRGIL